MSMSILSIFSRYPITRGMLVYSALWPLADLYKQAIQGRLEYNWIELGAYSLFGACVWAPISYTNVKFINYVVPAKLFGGPVFKALLDQVTTVSFLSALNLSTSAAKGKDWNSMVYTWRTTCLPVLEIDACFWPLAQTLNFAFVKERNLVPVIGLCHFGWTIFLMHMIQLIELDIDNEDDLDLEENEKALKRALEEAERKRRRSRSSEGK